MSAVPSARVDLGIVYCYHGSQALRRQYPSTPSDDLTTPADREIRYIGELLLRDGKPNVSRPMVWEVLTWGMMSYAERHSPGAMHRSSRRASS